MSGFAWHRKLMYFLRLSRISLPSSPIIELSVLVECGTFVIDPRAIKNEVNLSKIIDRYIVAIEKSEDSDFESHSVSQMMKYKMNCAQ